MILDFTQIIIMILCVLAALFCLLIGGWVGSIIGRHRAERSFRDRLQEGRSDAVKRSRSVLEGQFTEQLAPFLPDFPADPTEIRFIGKPVDYLAFKGSSAGIVEEVLFIEVKTGGSRLSPVESSLKAAIEAGKVRFVEYRFKTTQNNARSR